MIYALIGSSLGFAACAVGAFWLGVKLHETGKSLGLALAAKVDEQARRLFAEMQRDEAIQAQKMAELEMTRLAKMSTARAFRIEKLEKALADASSPADVRSRLDELLSKNKVPGDGSGAGGSG